MNLWNISFLAVLSLVQYGSRFWVILSSKALSFELEVHSAAKAGRKESRMAKLHVLGFTETVAQIWYSRNNFDNCSDC